MPKTVIQEGTTGRVESMQQSSATQSLATSFWGLRNDLPVVPSCIYSF